MNSVVDAASLRRTAPDRTYQRALVRAGGLGCVAVVIAMAGLAVAVDAAGARPFTSLRWAVVSTGVCVGAAAVRRWALPRWHLAAWAALIALTGVGAAVGPDPTTAWLGHPQRHLGVFAWVVFALAAALGAHLAERRRALEVLEVAAVIVAGNVAVTSIADALGWDPAGASFADGRVGGVFGQPVVLATVAVLLLPPVVAARRVGSIRWVVALGLAATIVLTQTRGAVVGLVAAAVVAAPTWTRRLRTPAQARTRVAVAVVVVGVAVAALVGPFGDRLRDATASSRVDEWALGVDVLADSPLVGVGPEGYRIAVLEHLDDAYVADYGRDVVVDRAHSAPLDVALSGGVLAGVLYVALVGSVVVATWRRQRRPAPTVTDRVAVAAGLGAVGAFAAEALSFPVPEVDVLVWLFAGVALAPAAVAHAGRWRARAGVGVATLAVAAALIAAWAGVTDVRADRDMGDAAAAAARGRTAAAVDAAQRAVERRGDLVDAHWLAASVAATGPTILDVDRAITAAEDGLDRFPLDPALRDLHARLLTERALRSSLPADVDAAVTALDDLSRTDPTSLVVESGTQRLADACLIRCNHEP